MLAALMSCTAKFTELYPAQPSWSQHVILWGVSWMSMN